MEVKSGKLCNVCGAVSQLTCGRCRAVHYCSRDHQRQDFAQHRGDCSNYVVESSQAEGRYVTATCLIKPGSLILKEEPFLIGPMASSDLVCLTCLAPIQDDDFYKCPDCLWPLCSKKCSFDESHALECDILAQDEIGIGRPKVRGETPRYELIMMLRALLLKKTKPKLWEVLMSMENHAEIRRTENDMYHDACIRYFTSVVKVDNTVDEMHMVRGAIVTNCLIFRNNFNISTRGMYSNVRLFNHACTPNVHIATAPNGEIEARAAVNIEKGESLNICYTGTMEPLWKRQRCLSKAYKFQCKCHRCTDPTELGTYFSSPRCPDCRRAFMLPPGDGSVDCWKCEDCGLKYEFIDVMQEVSEWSNRIEMTDLFTDKDSKKLSKEVDNMFDSFNEFHFLPHEYTKSMIKVLNNKTYQTMYLRKKIFESHLNIYNILEPGMTRRRGVTLCLLGTATLSMIKLGVEEKEIYVPRIPELLKETLVILREAEIILQLEPKESMERRWLITTQEMIRKLQEFNTQHSNGHSHDCSTKET